MMKRLTIDSSVIISSLLENESRHGEAMQIWDAADIAIQKGVRGMDALVMQTAKEYETELVTFDDEMMKKFQTP